MSTATTSEKPLVIDAQNITKEFRMGDIVVQALKGVNFQVRAGEFISIMGRSGSGKSTLMNILGCLDTPTSGSYMLDGVNVSLLSPDSYSKIRNRSIGFVFQGFNLLPRTSALENVQLPLLYCREPWFASSEEESKRVLMRVGMESRMDHLPNQLSGGQQQRVAIARALVNRPAIILADEPTGNLDSVNSLEIMALFQELSTQGVTIILVTHEEDIAQNSKRIVELHDGHIVRDHPVEHPIDAHTELMRLKSLGVTGAKR